MNYKQALTIMILAASFSTATAYGEGQAIKLKQPPSDIKEISRIIMPESIDYPKINKDNKEDKDNNECYDWKDDVQGAFGGNQDRILRYDVPEFTIENKSLFYIWSDDKAVRERITEWKITGTWDGLDLGLNIPGKVRLCLGGSAYDKKEPLPIDRYKSLYLWSYKINSEKPLAFRTVENYISWYPPYSSCTNARVVNYAGNSWIGTSSVIMACSEAYKKLDNIEYYILFFGTDGQMGVCRSN